MSFILGLFISLGLSSKNSGSSHGGVIFLPTLGDHSTDPFAAQDIQSDSATGRHSVEPLQPSSPPSVAAPPPLKVTIVVKS